MVFEHTGAAVQPNVIAIQRMENFCSIQPEGALHVHMVLEYEL